MSDYANPPSKLDQLITDIQGLSAIKKAVVILPFLLASLVGAHLLNDPAIQNTFAVSALFIGFAYIALIAVWGPVHDRFLDLIPTTIIFVLSIYLAAVYFAVEPTKGKKRYTEQELEMMYAEADSCMREAMDKARDASIPIHSVLVQNMAGPCYRQQAKIEHARLEQSQSQHNKQSHED